MEIIENFARHLDRAITTRNELVKDLEATRGLYCAAHQELIQIHHIGLCIAECPSVKADDTATVRMVKEMAYRLNKGELK